MKFLKPIVLIILLIGIGVHVYSLAVKPFPFTDEPTYSHYAHLASYIIALFAVWKLQMQSIGKILYALSIIYPVYYHARVIIHQFQTTIDQNLLACVAVVVFLPWGVRLFRK
ncbi:MAG TPA: hypothetical protein VGB95_05660 [Chitinophagales bacterium]